MDAKKGGHGWKRFWTPISMNPITFDGIASASEIAKLIRAKSPCGTQPDPSAGVSYNKVPWPNSRRDHRKPDGFFVIHSCDGSGFVESAECRQIHGIVR